MPILDHPLSGQNVWTGAQLQAADDWIERLEGDAIAEIERALAYAKSLNVPLFEISPDTFPLPTLGPRLEGLRAALEGGRGFAVLRGLPVANWALEDAKRVIWGLATHIGAPEPQDGAGNKMHSVTNTGKRVEGSDSNRGYETDDELKFHNDGGDAFMLLCLRTAKSGGISKLVSVGALFNEILHRRPDLAEVLQQPFHFDARNQNVHGLRVQSVPIFNYFENRLSGLYKRRLIELAQRFPEVPRLTPLQQQALDLLDALCNDPAMQLAFSMEPGDIQLGNNFAVFHSRTSYVDHDDVLARRHLLRVWMTLPEGRPLPEIFSTTREFGATWARRIGKSEQTAANTKTPALNT